MSGSIDGTPPQEALARQISRYQFSKKHEPKRRCGSDTLWVRPAGLSGAHAYVLAYHSLKEFCCLAGERGGPDQDPEFDVSALGRLGEIRRGDELLPPVNHDALRVEGHGTFGCPKR